MKAPDVLDECLHYLKKYGITDYTIIPSKRKINFICSKNIANKIIEQMDNVSLYKATIEDKMWVTIKG